MAEKLSPAMGNEISRFIAEKRMEGKYNLKQLIKLISRLEKYDLKIEKRMKIFLILSIVFFILSLVTLFIFPFAIIVTIILAIIFLILRLINKGKDLSNDFRLLLFPFLKELNEDIDLSAKIAIKMPLSKFEDKSNFLETTPVYKKGVYHKCIDFIYEREELSLNIPMRDGNAIDLNVQKLMIKTQKTKRNPRGKSKTKIKYKEIYTFIPQIFINKKRFAPNSNNVSGKIKVGNKVIKDKIVIKTKNKRPVDIALLIEKILVMYQNLTLAEQKGV